MAETGHIVETGTIHENTKETSYMIEIDYMTEMIHIVETGHIVETHHESTVEMSIREENHKYKRSKEYYEDAYEDRHSRDKYKHTIQK